MLSYDSPVRFSERIAPIAAILVLVAAGVGPVAAAGAQATSSDCDIVGTPGDDILTGTDAGEVICGLGGDDVIRGGRGNDIIEGGPGNDRLIGGAGNDLIRGGTGNDRLHGQTGRDRLVGNGGNDLLNGGGGRDRIIGGGGSLDVCRDVGVLAAVRGCEVGIGSPDNDVERARVRQRFVPARDLWEASSIDHYAFTFRNSCFCVPMTDVRVTVREGQIVDTTPIDSDPQLFVPDARTIDQHLERLAGALDDPDATIVVEFDAVFGFPRHYAIDPDPRTADEEIFVEIFDFAVVIPVTPPP